MSRRPLITVRKFLATMVGCTALLSTAAAQATNERLDSLWRAYRAAAPTDPGRLLTFHEIVWETRMSDNDSARVLARDFLLEAEAMQDTLGLAMAHVDLGNVAVVAGDHDAALGEYRKAMDLYAGTPDSTATSGIAKCIHSMGVVYKRLGRLDTALVLYRRSMAMDKRHGHRSGLMYSCNSIGVLYQTLGQNDSALYYYAKSGDMAKELGNRAMLGGSLGNQANVYERMGLIGRAIDLAYKSLQIYESLGHERDIAISLTTVSSLKNTLGDKEGSLEVMRRAHALYRKAGFPQGVMNSGDHIGDALLELGKPDSAIRWLERSVALEREFNANDIMGRTLMNLGAAYRSTGRLAEARKVLRESLANSRALNTAPVEAAALAELGRVALAGGDADEAILLCGQGHAVALAAGALSERAQNCDCLYLAHKARGEGLAGLRYLEEYHRVQDSLVSARNTRELNRREMVHGFAKQQLADSLRNEAALERIEQARALEEMRADRQRRTAWGVAGGGLLLAAGLTAFFISDRKRRKARFEQESAQLETRALRAQMNPHFIFNALNSISVFVQRNEPIKATGFLSRFARLMRLVLENSRQAEVPLKDDIEALEAYLHLERARSGDKFDYRIDVDPAIDQEAVRVPPLVIQPFVENAIWHGMAGRTEKGHITLSVRREGEQLLMAIEDDGVGRHGPKPVDVTGDGKKTSLATAITKARLDLVQKQKGRPAGFTIIDLPQGTRVELRLPIG